MRYTLNLSASFNSKTINNLAISTGLIKRVRKLTGVDFVLAILHTSAETVVSFNAVSSSLFMNLGKDVSRQRLHKAISANTFLNFFGLVTKEILLHRMLPVSSGLKNRFGRVLVQDSTVLRLPDRLFGDFSGVGNAISRVTNCRVQLCIDLITNMFNVLSIESYSTNDLSSRSLVKTRKRDLIIRDRGYISLDQLHDFLKRGVFFITRPKSNFTYFDKKGNPIDLRRVLSKKKTTVIKVRVGDCNAPLFNLVAQKVTEEIAAKRRRACKISTKGHNPSKNTLALLSWSIYLTSIEEENLTFEQIWELYSLRWRIEIIFKALKSNVNFDSIHQVSSNQLIILIQARIMLVLLMVIFIYNPLQKHAKRTGSKKTVSLFKLVSVLAKKTHLLFQYIEIINSRKPSNQKDKLCNTLIRLSAYDKRKRLNYCQLKNQISLS